MTEDAMRVLAGHPIILSFSTIPEWMFKTPKPVAIPDNPDEIMSTTAYEQGTELRDPTCHEVAEYFARIASWYADGGFTDELGKWHPSGHHYKIDYWEVLNEPDVEHAFTPQQYTKLYDAVVEAMRKVLPHTKFIGLTDSYPGGHPELFEYFLNPKNHRPGIPLDAISYHFYAVPGFDEPSSVYPYTFFLQAERFIEAVHYIETIRKRYSPHTETMIDEIGTMLPDDWNQSKPGYYMKPIDPSYWNLSGAVYAYVYAQLARTGIRVASESMLPAYPGNYASIALVDWKTGKPNARLQVLKLIHDNFSPGDKLVDTQTSDGRVFAQGFLGKNGSKKILLINERRNDFRVKLPESQGGKIEFIDEENGSRLSSVSRLPNGNFRLGAFGVAVVTLP
jgi:hypothetical protein